MTIHISSTQDLVTAIVHSVQARLQLRFTEAVHLQQHQGNSGMLANGLKLDEEAKPT